MVAGGQAFGNGGRSGLRMEPCWTEPPPLAWVSISAREWTRCRRQSETVASRVPERHGWIVAGRENEHVAQGHGNAWSERCDGVRCGDHEQSSGDGGGRSAATDAMTRNVPAPHSGHRR